MARTAPLVLFLVLMTLLGATAEARAQVAGPSYPKTLLGTVGGGLVGATVAGGTLAAVGWATGDGDEFISPAALGLIYGGVLGSWLGQAVGGSWGSATDSQRLSRTQLLWPSALWTSAGLVVFGLIGTTFEAEDTPGTDASWYIGAAVGALVQVAGMSVTTYRSATNASRAAAPVSFSFYPSADSQLMAAVRLRLGRPF